MSAPSAAPKSRLMRFIADRRATERSRGDLILGALCLAAGLVATLVLFEIAYQVTSGARPAIAKFGLGFLGHSAWAPNFDRFGAAVMLYGTAVTSVIAMVIAVPMSIAIALYLAMLAPRAVRTVVGPLVEMLAAIPSVILGFWGLIFLAPWVHTHVEPFLYNTFGGFLPIFGPPQTTGLSLFTGGLILTVMVLPIISSLSRDRLAGVDRTGQNDAVDRRIDRALGKVGLLRFQIGIGDGEIGGGAVERCLGTVARRGRGNRRGSSAPCPRARVVMWTTIVAWTPRSPPGTATSAAPGSAQGRRLRPCRPGAGGRPRMQLV